MKTSFVKYKQSNRYDLKLYFPPIGYDSLVDFISFHIFKRMKEKVYISREYSNRSKHSILVVENLTYNQATKLEIYVNSMFKDFFRKTK